MIDQTTINFLAKLSLACLLVSLTLLKNVDCRTLQTQQRQYSEISAAAAPSASQTFQYQQHEPSPYIQQASSQSSPSYQQYYEQQPQPQSVQYQNFNNKVQSSSSNKPNRRSILSSIMAPFYAMRDQGMEMIQASLRGCDPNTFSMWCRFWSMVMGKR